MQFKKSEMKRLKWIQHCIKTGLCVLNCFSMSYLMHLKKGCKHDLYIIY